MVILFFGMIPAFVAYIIDRSKGKSASFCVGSMNFIGVFPYIVKLWGSDNTFQDAFAVTGDLVTILVMYSASAFGWLLFLGLPSLISTFVIIIQQRKVAQLRGEQKELIEEWGAEVASLVTQQHTDEQEHHIKNAFRNRG